LRSSFRCLTHSWCSRSKVEQYLSDYARESFCAVHSVASHIRGALEVEVEQYLSDYARESFCAVHSAASHIRGALEVEQYLSDYARESFCAVHSAASHTPKWININKIMHSWCSRSENKSTILIKIMHK
jgi:hypothetical protein